ncbi:S8 family serine peptidase [Pseudomarimonas arenosa]|uniref:S8 family serine peptidase n=1 Tax=Pseudomarimonas arenosa TaxID=2774145 RepID=A0AAW3ZHS2_9GAMM|nr:S8 family serine peptidase [Pseudomarimonas arenosa]
MSKQNRFNALAVSVTLAFAGAASAGDAPERYIVNLHDGVSPQQMTRSLMQQKAAGRVHHNFEELGAFAATMTKDQLRALQSDPRVKSVEVDPPRYPMAQTQPYGIGQIGAPTAWAAGHNGAGVMVCVIDSGIKADHEDFAGLDIRGGYPSGWNSDSCGHGTHVAGTIAAQDNSTGVVGVATGSLSMYFVQVFSGASCGWSYASDLIDAANRCKTAADAAGKKLVINMSLGGGSSNTAESNGFQNLYNQGVLSIAAAGNDGNSTMSYPASYNSVMSVAAIDSAKAKADFSQYNSQVEISAPGVAVLSTYPIASATTTVGGAGYIVAAMTNSPQLSRTGAIVNGGTCESVGSWSGKVVLCQRGNISFEQKVLNAQSGGGVAAIVYNNAPGSFGGTLSTPTGTTIPSVSMSQEDGQEIIASRLNQSTNVNTIANNNASAYASLDGTSMASPHAAGAAAVIWSSNLSASNVDVRNAITSTAEDLGTSGRDNNFGYGMIRIPQAIAALGGPTPDTTPPSTVSSLSASASGTSAVNLSWSAATDTGGSGLAGYKVERCAGASCSSFTQIATTASTSYADSGLTAATTYRYRVRAYDGAGNNGNYSGIGQATTDSAPPTGGTVLANGVPVTGLSGSTGTQLAYTMVVPAGASNLSFNLSGGSGDADLYVRFGSAPTTSSYDCRSWASGNTESCTFASPQAGTYYVMVNAYSTFSGASLTGSFTPPSGGTGPSFFENTTDAAIPDNNSTGVYSNIAVSGRSGNAPSNLQVAVDIKHTYIGDLIVDLVAPDGSVYNLHNRTGAGADNIQQTYTVNASSEAANGTWRLRVRDRARRDTGYIDSWSMQF